jgi:fatty acid CoA ligase FadD9
MPQRQTSALFVDWLEGAGQKIDRIDDYGEWLARFETALTGLPEKQQSVLPLLQVYREPERPLPGAVAAPTEMFHSAVRAAKVGEEKHIPHLSESLINKYVADLEQIGLLFGLA